MSDISNLIDVASTLTKLVVKAEHKHMKEPWQMILGGLILPEIVKLDPKVLDEKPDYKKLLAKYDKTKVLEFFKPKTVEKVVEKEKIVEKVIEKKVPVTVTVPGDKVVVAEKVRYRRLKDDGVKKVSRLEREIMPHDRNTIIIWWNKNQRLVPDDDPVCKEIADKINTTKDLKPLAPAQVAGYFSHLCRMGMSPAAYREARFIKNMEFKNISVLPLYSNKLLEEIKENNAAEKADEAIMKAEHEKMRAAKAAGSHLKVGTPVGIVKTEIAADPIPDAPVVVEDKPEEFDIKFM